MAVASLIRIIRWLTLAALLSSCAGRVWNREITEVDPAPDYVFANRLPKTNAQDLFVVLAFSGGGTRASAFSYGVLEALRTTEITLNGRARPLLDEVDVITAVSGGGYTAAYYGLFGDRIFDDFEDKFLNRNFQARLVTMPINPFNLISLMNPRYNGGDLVARWLDKHLFEHKTFADLSLGRLPFVIINASDLNTGSTFSFIQQQFDFLCSRLTRFPVASAVVASSSVPGALGPLAIRNYDSDCPQRDQAWVRAALDDSRPHGRVYQVARALRRYASPGTMPVIRLVDGGVTDNLGVRGSMMSPIAHHGNVRDMAGAFTPAALDKVTRVLVIVANAEVESDYSWSRKGRDPGIVATLRASFRAALNLLNNQTLAIAENEFNAWAGRVNARRAPDRPKVRVSFIPLTFAAISEPAKRDYFNALPTRFKLTHEQVGRVRALAGRLLGADPAFQAFLADLR